MSPEKSIYHRMGPGNENNTKYVSPDGHHEAVFHPDGTSVTDPANMATYNFYSPYDAYGVPHVINDVIPYFIWGNSPDDPANFWERITGTYDGSSPCE